MKKPAREILDRYFDDELSPDDLEQLTAWLVESPEHAAEFTSQARLDFLLKEAWKSGQACAVDGAIITIGGSHDQPMNSAVSTTPTKRQQNLHSSGIQFSVPLAVALLIMAVAGPQIWLAWSQTPQVKEQIAGFTPSIDGGFAGHGVGMDAMGAHQWHGVDEIARVTGLRGVVWLTGHQRMLGERLSASMLRFAEGTVRVVFKSGVVASVVGPAELHLLSGDHARLIAGTFVAYAHPGAEGFRLDTPGAEITDLGTEFGASVDRNGKTDLSVFDGSVQLVSKTGGNREIFTQGQGASISAKGVMRPQFSLEAFEEPRDAISGYKIVWEPFGPGSATGPFPGLADTGWLGPWQVRAAPDGESTRLATIVDSQPLHPGAQWYLHLHSGEGDGRQTVRLEARRPYGSVDSFSIEKPYVLECLVRVQSNPLMLSQFEIAGFARGSAAESEVPSWHIVAGQDTVNGGLRWQRPLDDRGKDVVAGRPVDTLMVDWWEPWRVCVAVDPPQHRWRFMLASSTQSWASGWHSLDLATGGPVDSHEIVFGATGNKPHRLSFAIDEVKIRNRP